MDKLKLLAVLTLVSIAITSCNNRHTVTQENKTNHTNVKNVDEKYLGEFVMKQFKNWVELDGHGAIRSNLVETRRDEWSIHLKDQERNVEIQIDLYQNKIFNTLADGSTKIHKYNVMSPADQSVSGHNASRIIFGAKTETSPVVLPQDGYNGLHGYLGFSISTQNELVNYNAGVGFYTSVWPLVSKPLYAFQIGLPSIWLTPDNSDNDRIPLCPVGTVARDNWPERAPTYRDVFQTIEGGVGYWSSVHFKTGVPKFSINGVSQCYDYQMASPGWSFFSSNTPLAENKMGIAQLSNRLLIPPDALTFKGNPNGELIGYTWMALPLAESTYEGEFIRKEGKNWVELDKNGKVRFNFTEKNRDEWSIHLYDESRKIKIQIDLWKDKIYWISEDGKSTELYNVMHPADRSVSAQIAQRVIFASTNARPPVNRTPTGGNSWTLFMNSKNFKGPVAFFIPDAWSRIASVFDESYNIGKGLDTKLASLGSGSAAMEINTVPYFTGTDKNGIEYTKIPPLYFPVDSENRSILVRDLKLYSKDALFNSTEAWRKGGSATIGSFVDKGFRPKLRANNAYYKHQDKNIKGLNDVARSTIFPNENAWGIQWDKGADSPPGQFPQYFKSKGDEYVPIIRSEVPKLTGLLDKAFRADIKGQAYVAPATGVWKISSALDNSYTATLNDGSVVTYKWYRFIDQPSLQHFNFSNEKKNELQRFVEKIHKEWTIDKEYMEPPSGGSLLSLDDALIVKPPAGLEYGYVPIVVRQE